MGICQLGDLYAASSSAPLEIYVFAIYMKKRNSLQFLFILGAIIDGVNAVSWFPMALGGKCQKYWMDILVIEIKPFVI